MKIGLISTAYSIPTPPNTFGGMERINYWLACELVRRGHDVTLFGCKGSKLEGGTVVELPGGGEVWPLDPNEPQEYPPFFDFMLRWIQDNPPMDVFHDSSHHHEFTRRLADICSVSTIHNPNPPESHNSIFISNFHRNHLGQPLSPYVMNGCPTDEFEYSFEKENYVVFMGALGLHKGFDRVVKFAVEYEVPLKLAGHPMGEQEIQILETAKTYPWIEYLGVIGGQEKNDVLRRAAAVLAPFKWPEPGCIIAVEAMACGTPIIASSAGVLPEYVVDGQTGFITGGDPQSLWRAFNSLDKIRPVDCRQRFLENFTIERVANEYEVLYRRAFLGDDW